MNIIRVSKEDIDLLNSNKWYKCKSRNTFYAQNSKGIRLHRLIMIRVVGHVLKANEHVDHINKDGLDNRRYNLRLCSNAENSRNTKSRVNSTSKYLGVYRQRNKWAAKIQTCGVVIYLGCYKTQLEAARAYNNAALFHHGKFASLNRVGR